MKPASLLCKAMVRFTSSCPLIMAEVSLTSCYMICPSKQPRPKHCFFSFLLGPTFRPQQLISHQNEWQICHLWDMREASRYQTQ
ncbi:hypothetical protein V8F33_002013 [Rhypophila sp. PSN 637]